MDPLVPSPERGPMYFRKIVGREPYRFVDEKLRHRIAEFFPQETAPANPIVEYPVYQLLPNRGRREVDPVRAPDDWATAPVLATEEAISWHQTESEQGFSHKPQPKKDSLQRLSAFRGSLWAAMKHYEALHDEDRHRLELDVFSIRQHQWALEELAKHAALTAQVVQVKLQSERRRSGPPDSTCELRLVSRLRLVWDLFHGRPVETTRSGFAAFVQVVLQPVTGNSGRRYADQITRLYRTRPKSADK
jgi:hypothetical protein